MKFNAMPDEDFTGNWFMSFVLIFMLMSFLRLISNEIFPDSESLKRQITPEKIIIIDKAISKEDGIYFSKDKNWVHYDSGAKRSELTDIEKKYVTLRLDENAKIENDKIKETDEKLMKEFIQKQKLEKTE